MSNDGREKGRQRQREREHIVGESVRKCIKGGKSKRIQSAEDAIASLCGVGRIFGDVLTAVVQPSIPFVFYLREELMETTEESPHLRWVSQILFHLE